MSGRILVVEDDDYVRESVGRLLEDAGFTVDGVADGAAAVAAIRRSSPDLVVLDLMLPGLDGFGVCREVRRFSTVPIVMLTARDGTTDVVTGLELGADDYVTKPFEPEVLAARVRAVVRRTGEMGALIEVNDLHIDEAASEVCKGDEVLALTTTEMRLLAELARRAGTVLSREELLELVWGYDYLGDSRLVDMAVRRLRAKLGEAPGGGRYVATVRGIGYRFERSDQAGTTRPRRRRRVGNSG